MIELVVAKTVCRIDYVVDLLFLDKVQDDRSMDFTHFNNPDERLE